ncbi:MAG: FtsX-like permease family protein [Clostridium sp.]
MIKKNIFNFIIFFIVCFFMIFLSEIILNGVRIINENNNLRGKNDKVIEVNTIKEVYGKNIEKELLDSNDIYIEKDGMFLEAFVGKNIYFNSEKIIEPIILEGRFFNNSDFDKENKIVIGKNMLKLTSEKNNKRYIRVLGKDVEVIGVMGSSKRKSAFDNTFYLNNFFETRISEGSLIIGGNNVDKNVEILENKLRNLDRNISIEKGSFEGFESPLGSVMYKNKYILIIASLLIITLLFNVINTTNYYVLDRKKEIGIRRLIGSTKIGITKEILLEYIKIASLASALAIVVYNLILMLNLYPKELDLSFNIITVIIIFGVLNLLAIILAIPSIIKSNKVQISYIMKGDS